jgi:hypothetical protein
MENIKLGIILAIVGVAFLGVGLGIGGVLSPTCEAPVGGLIHNVQESFDEGIAVDGTEVISGTGGVSFTSGAFSTTLTVTGESNVDTLVYGGDITSIATDTAYTLTAAQVCDSSVIEFLASTTGDCAVTFPATTTLYADCLLANGDSKDLIFRNISAAAGTTTTMTLGSGMVLLESDNGADGDVVIAGGNSVIVKLIRTTGNEILGIIEELRDAD